jgi:II/X family phage/plasmid replication protein
MLIDWLTLRFPLSLDLGVVLYNRLMDCLGITVCISADGVEQWRKNNLDIDKLRSDSEGIFWSITADGQSMRYLTIGASPASLEFGGCNVFGSLDIAHSSQVLIKAASVALECVLPAWKKWDCRRIDITANYDMGSPAQVKQALRLLLSTDAPRRRTNSDRAGGDSVYWNPTSTLGMGKAYHKGAQLRMLQRKGHILLSDVTLFKADNLLRLEHKVGSQYFRRLEQDWKEIFTPEFLIKKHHDFFSKLIGCGDVEVCDMGTLLQELEKVAPTKGYALAAHRTWALIKSVGYIQTKDSMPKATFMRHCSFLRAAGLSSADLCAGVVIPFRKRSLVLGQPVTCWEDIKLERAA